MQASLVMKRTRKRGREREERRQPNTSIQWWLLSTNLSLYFRLSCVGYVCQRVCGDLGLMAGIICHGSSALLLRQHLSRQGSQVQLSQLVLRIPSFSAFQSWSSRQVTMLAWHSIFDSGDLNPPPLSTPSRRFNCWASHQVLVSIRVLKL